MSTFEVKIYQAQIEPHSNADSLELCKIEGYTSIVRKGQFNTGDLVAYIPEASIVPDSLLEEMGLVGMLAGSKKNRVKAVKLRGVLSQGLVYPARSNWNLDQDVTDELGITKFEPEVPTTLSGAAFSMGSDFALGYDIENFKKYRNCFEKGQEVIFTEKLHGTNCRLCVLPKDMARDEPFASGRVFVTSKGLGGQGIFYKSSEVPENKNNAYVNLAEDLRDHGGIEDKVDSYLDGQDEVVHIFGEIFGQKIQDLTYGFEKPTFRVFDVYLGMPKNGCFLNDSELDDFCARVELQRVPVLYRGPYSLSKVEEYTQGKETLSGKGLHVREGVVIRPTVETVCTKLYGDRLQLKSVSTDYLLRKGGTEYT